jgi:outer membrane protein assembly factor BamB
VWVSFRTGMLGRSVLLSSTSLSVINGFPTGTSRAASPVTGPGTIGSWPMSESALYAAGALWVATGGGLLACVNPRTGQVRAEETTRSQATILLAADRAANTVFAVTGDAGIAAISPPPICWT